MLTQYHKWIFKKLIKQKQKSEYEENIRNVENDLKQDFDNELFKYKGFYDAEFVKYIILCYNQIMCLGTPKKPIYRRYL